MLISLAKRDGCAQAEGDPEEVLEVLRLLLKNKKVDGVTWASSAEHASVCWALEEECGTP